MPKYKIGDVVVLNEDSMYYPLWKNIFVGEFTVNKVSFYDNNIYYRIDNSYTELLEDILRLVKPKLPEWEI